jgi:hypothetical protein
MSAINSSRPSENTLKIQHEKLQKEIENAIRSSNTNDDMNISFQEFKQTLFNLHYLVNLQQQQSYKYTERSSSPSMRGQINSRAEEDRALLTTLWNYINPLGLEYVDKASTFDFLLLLVFNVSRLSESDLQDLLAKHLIEYIGTNFGVQFEMRGQFTDVQVVNHHMTEIVKTWPIKKLIQAFVKDHVRRYGHFDRSRSVTTIPRDHAALLKNKSLKDLIPRDHRYYHGETFDHLQKSFPFKP